MQENAIIIYDMYTMFKIIFITNLIHIHFVEFFTNDYKVSINLV